MKALFYTAIAINAAALASFYAATFSRVLSDFHREANWALALLAAWVLGSLMMHRLGWNWLAAAMAWFTAILLPAAALAGVFLLGWIQQNFKSPGAFR